MSRIIVRSETFQTTLVVALKEAYKEEACLYAINTPNHHNKYLRSEAVKRGNDSIFREIFPPGKTLIIEVCELIFNL